MKNAIEKHVAYTQHQTDYTHTHTTHTHTQQQQQQIAIV